ncbi:hypothetical protein [Bounagaea algeriensis]
MRYLREHGDEIAEGKKRQLERSARRREYLGGKLAAAGGSSWDALKTAAQKARDAKRAHGERKAEDAAHDENARRDEDEAHNRNDYRAGGGDPDASEVPSEDDPAAEQSGADNATDGNGEATVLPFARRDCEDQEGSTESTENQSTQSDSTGGSGGETAAQKGSENAEKVKTTGPDPEKDMITDPDKGTCRISIAELHRRRAREEDDRRQAEEAELRAHEAEQAQAEREHTERMAQIQQQSTSSTTASTGGDTMNAPQSSSVEITDLETAQLRSDESAQYAATVQSVLDTQIAGIQKAIAGMEAEAAQQEQGSTSLTGEGFDTGITGRFDRGQQSFTNAVAALRQLDQALNTAKDEVNLAQNEMTSASSFFSQQRSISESLSAAGQGGGISSRTGFYTGA